MQMVEYYIIFVSQTKEKIPWILWLVEKHCQTMGANQIKKIPNVNHMGQDVSEYNSYI